MWVEEREIEEEFEMKKVFLSLKNLKTTQIIIQVYSFSFQEQIHPRKFFSLHPFYSLITFIPERNSSREDFFSFSYYMREWERRKERESEWEREERSAAITILFSE